MAKVTLRNLSDISRRDPHLGQALSDAVSHISDIKTQLAAAQQQILALQQKK